MTIYSVYADVKNSNTEETMRTNEVIVYDLRTALVVYRSDPQFSGIMEQKESEPLTAHPIYYYEEKLRAQKKNIKYPQHVLAFDAKLLNIYFPGYNSQSPYSVTPVWHLDAQSYMDFMDDNSLAVIMRREELEENENYLQVLPYILVRVDTPEGSKFLLYKRPDKGTGEERLRGHYSLGFGGHVDISDIELTGNVIELHSTLGFAASREISEELKITRENKNVTGDFSIEFMSHFILDRTAAVHRAHIATIAVLVVEAVSFDHFEFNCPYEEGNGNVIEGLFATEELLEMSANKDFPMEAWTRAVVRELQNPASILRPYSEAVQLTMTLDGRDLGDEISFDD